MWQQVFWYALSICRDIDMSLSKPDNSVCNGRPKLITDFKEIRKIHGKSMQHSSKCVSLCNGILGMKRRAIVMWPCINKKFSQEFSHVNICCPRVVSLRREMLFCKRNGLMVAKHRRSRRVFFIHGGHCRVPLRKITRLLCITPSQRHILCLQNFNIGWNLDKRNCHVSKNAKTASCTVLNIVILTLAGEWMLLWLSQWSCIKQYTKYGPATAHGCPAGFRETEFARKVRLGKAGLWCLEHQKHRVKTLTYSSSCRLPTISVAAFSVFVCPYSGTKLSWDVRRNVEVQQDTNGCVHQLNRKTLHNRNWLSW